MARVKSPQDFWAGLLFLVVGCLALWFGRNYAGGTVMRMGPGFLPRALSWALIGIGVLLALRALVLSGPGIEGSLIRPQFFIVLSIIVFGILIERFGLAPAVFVVTILAALASYEMKWIEAVSLAFASAVASVVLFIYLLGQSMEKWTF
jgi:hypothetical protein